MCREASAPNSNSASSCASNPNISSSKSNPAKPHKSHSPLHFHFPPLSRMPHSLHLHLPLLHFPLSKKGGGGHHDFYKHVPKGCLALYVGQGEEQRRFVIPVVYVNHPLFEKLLKEAEEEYGFEQKGTITIPCHVSDFQYVQDLIGREQHESHGHGGGCFR